MTEDQTMASPEKNETAERIKNLFEATQKSFEAAVMQRAEAEILISRLKRETSDLDHRIAVLDKTLLKYGEKEIEREVRDQKCD